MQIWLDFWERVRGPLLANRPYANLRGKRDMVQDVVTIYSPYASNIFTVDINRY